MEAQEIMTVFRVFKTVLKMLQDRNYVIKPELFDLKVEEFKELYRP